MSNSHQPRLAPALIDSHCHLDFPVFDQDRSKALESALEGGIIASVIPAISYRHWQRVHKVASSSARLFATYGLHPMFMGEHEPEHLEALKAWLNTTTGSVGIGECGLDYFIDKPDKVAQRFYFEGQLTLAKDNKLPIVIHARRAVEDVIDCIRFSGHHQGVLHSFNGSLEQAKRLIDLGFVMSFGGAITYERATRLRQLVRQLPLDAILLETDSPDQPDCQHRGLRNEPAWLVDVFDCVCELRPEDPTVIATTTTRNTANLFGLPLKQLQEFDSTDKVK